MSGWKDAKGGERTLLVLQGERWTELWLEDGNNNDVSQERCVADEIRNAKPETQTIEDRTKRT